MSNHANADHHSQFVKSQINASKEDEANVKTDCKRKTQKENSAPFEVKKSSTSKPPCETSKSSSQKPSKVKLVSKTERDSAIKPKP
jgi:hypothetical protein